MHFGGRLGHKRARWRGLAGAQVVLQSSQRPNTEESGAYIYHPGFPTIRESILAKPPVDNQESSFLKQNRIFRDDSFTTLVPTWNSAALLMSSSAVPNDSVVLRPTEAPLRRNTTVVDCLVSPRRKRADRHIHILIYYILYIHRYVCPISSNSG